MAASPRRACGGELSAPLRETSGGVLDSASLARAFASAGGEPVEHDLVVAGAPVRLRFASPALIPLVTRSLAHLVAAGAPAPELTIDIWDASSTSSAAPPLPEPRGGEAPGAFYVVEREPFFAVGRPGHGYLSACDVAAGHAWHWVADADDVLFGDVAGPLRAIFQWWAASRGVQLVHGGAVGDERGGVLLVGKGGSGKSTTTLACLAAGFDFAGDDHVLVRPGPSPQVHSLYSACKLHPHHAARFPGLMPPAWNADRLDVEKAVGFVHDAHPDRTTAGFPLHAVVLPTVTGRERSAFRPASGPAALAALAPSTVFQLTGSRGDALAAMAAIVRAVPSYSLECGTDLEHLAATVRRILDDV